VLDARDNGIDTVYQDLALINELTVYQNLFLKREHVAKPIPYLANRRMRKEARTALEATGINIPRSDVPVARLSGGQRQAIAVARTVSGDADVILLDGPLAAMGTACPFCSATAQTFSEEITTMDVVVIARLVAGAPKKDKAEAGFGSEIPKARFEIVRIVKGEGLARPKETIETLYFGDAKIGTAFLVMGIDPPNVMWSTPLPLSDKAQDYLGKIVKLPKEGAERYTFFQNYLENDDEMLARDAYDEFAKGVKIAVDEAGLNKDIKIYSADISTSDIAAMREPDSAWAATAARSSWACWPSSAAVCCWPGNQVRPGSRSARFSSLALASAGRSTTT
jgi:hypothetical protein